MSDPYAAYNGRESRRPPSTRSYALKARPHGEDEQPNESISKRGIEGPPRIGKARVPLPRNIHSQRSPSGGSGSTPPSSQLASTISAAYTANAGIPGRNRDTWAFSQPALSLVDSLNSTYKLNEMQPQHRSHESSPARARRTSTDSKSPPAKRRKLSTTPSASLSSLLPTPTSSFASIPSTASSYTTRTSRSPAVLTQNVADGDLRQETAPKRKAPPLPRLPRKPQSIAGTTPPSMAGPSRAYNYASSVGTVGSPGQSNPSMKTPSDTPTRLSREKPRSAASYRQSDSPSQMLPPPRTHILTPSPSPVAAHSSVHVKAEPITESLPPPHSAPQTPVHDTPQQASVKSEPVAASLPPSPSRSSHPPEQATSGTERVHPIPENCRPGAQNWNENRQQWMHAAVRNVKRKGLKVTRVKLLSDGLVIDWERSPRTGRSSRSVSTSASEQTTAAPPAIPSQPPPSSAGPGSATSAHALDPRPPTPSAPVSSAPTSAPTSVASPSTPAPPQDTTSSPPQDTTSSPDAPSPSANTPAAPDASAPNAAKMSMFAKMIARQKKIQAEKQAAARQQMELEALKRQEEAAHRVPSPLPATPPPPESPPRFRLDTPPPPWETDAAEPAPHVEPIPLAQAQASSTPTPAANSAPTTPPSKSPNASSSPSRGAMPSSPSKPPRTASSSSRGSSIDAVAKMVHAPEFSDDDDMYMDPNDPSPGAWLAASWDVRLEGGDGGEVAKTEGVDADAAPPNEISKDAHSVDPGPAATAPPSLPPVPAPPSPPSAPSPQPPTSTSTSLVLSATQEGLPSPTDAEREQLEDDAVEWLKQYIITFDGDRSALAASYSQHATFSLRTLVHPFSASSTSTTTSVAPSPAAAPNAPTPDAPTTTLPTPSPILTGPPSILPALLALPPSFRFHGGAARAPRVLFDLVVAFDMVVYGSTADAGGPGVLVVCYIDPAGPGGGGRGAGGGESGERGGDVGEREWEGEEGEEEERDGKRWVCEMQFVLRRRCWNECDGSVAADGGAGLVALSHQMTLRRVPAGMAWNWE